MPARTAVMAILNVTPDSFYDGGRYQGLDAALSRAWTVVEEGADVLDIGGESTRPGAADIGGEEEAARVQPVIERLVAQGYPLPISVDTTRADVAAAAVDAGAVIVNDVSGGLREPAILGVAARAGAAVILMHLRGTPRTMAANAEYEDVVGEVADALALRCAAADEAGIPRASQCVDPGIGFAKTAVGSLELLARIRALRELGRPVLVGASRKSFLGHLFGQHGDQRRWGSLAVAAWSAIEGADIVRVHDVEATRGILDVTRGLLDARDSARALSHPSESL